MHKFWIRYENQIIALNNISHISFAPSYSPTTQRNNAQINIYFGESTAGLAILGQQADDLWAIFQSQSLNLTRRDDDKTDERDFDNCT